MFTPRGPVAGSFQHTLWPRGRASEAAILVSCAFAFVFSWYKAIIALTLCFSSGALQHIVHTSIIAAKIVSLNFFFELQYFGPDLRLARAKTAIPIRSVQNADCFFVWFVITCHLTNYRASRDRFSAIIFDDYLHYCGMFLACFLIPILHIVFSLCAQVGLCDICTEYTSLIKVDVDVDVNEMSLFNI